jgi:hypothetical protein
MGHVGEVSTLGQILLRGFQNENDFRARFLGQDICDVHRIQSDVGRKGGAQVPVWLEGKFA